MAKQWEHGMLTANSTSTELMLHTVNGAEVLSHDGIGPRQVLTALNDLSGDGWEVVGPPTAMQGNSLSTITYLLRRPQTGEPTVY